MIIILVDEANHLSNQTMNHLTLCSSRRKINISLRAWAVALGELPKVGRSYNDRYPPLQI